MCCFLLLAAVGFLDDSAKIYKKTSSRIPEWSSQPNSSPLSALSVPCIVILIFVSLSIRFGFHFHRQNSRFLVLAFFLRLRKSCFCFSFWRERATRSTSPMDSMDLLQIVPFLFSCFIVESMFSNIDSTSSKSPWMSVLAWELGARNDQCCCSWRTRRFLVVQCLSCICFHGRHRKLFNFKAE